jgi:hypothetical protein
VAVAHGSWWRSGIADAAAANRSEVAAAGANGRRRRPRDREETVEVVP